ncbi:MAG: FkbM family methyltransferase [Alphaproteobacteria bacterium]
MEQEFSFNPLLDALNSRLANVEAALLEQRKITQDIQELVRQVRQLVGPFAVPVSPDELLVQTLFGVKFYVPARDQLITPQLVVYRQWEAQLSRLLPRLAPAGSVFVDIGANFGYFTCLVATGMKATPGSRVIAVEPNPEMLRLLEINTRINWSMAPVRVVAAALADKRGTRLLHVPANAAGNATLVATDGESRGTASAPAEKMTTVEVEVLRLDDVLRNEAKLDLIKVDVEGFETAVFRGGSETLQRPGLKIVFEWAQGQTRAAGFQPATILEMLRQYGYRLFDAESYLDAAAPLELTDEALLATPYANVLALRD